MIQVQLDSLLDPPITSETHPKGINTKDSQTSEVIFLSQLTYILDSD